MPELGIDREQGCGADAAAVQAVTSCLGAGRTFPASDSLHLTFKSIAASENEPVRRFDRSDRTSRPGIQAGGASDIVAPQARFGAPDHAAPMTRLTIGWSIAVPDT